ncbi:MAG: hypothetical protein ACI8WP_000837 [Flavobacteriaceae bacterium]|jgi:hypothetical protein
MNNLQITLLGFSLCSLGMLLLANDTISNDQPVAELLFDWGESKPDHYLELITPEMVQRGEDIIKLGRTIGPDGKRSKYVSKYYACTICHNVKRKEADLTKVDQDARLDYAIANKVPYLQGSTFWEIVNR